MTTLLDPTSERSSANLEPLPRLQDLTGKTVGLLDISKPRGDVFIDRLEDLLVQRGINTKRYSKPTFTRVAPVELKQQIATECDAVIESLAD
ncbi:MAG: hypothetical protein HOE54_13490 [Gammaproteobacteria bacterium]|jgi:hypothetical protein|nr:hypothetical protein [Gammaproteobacteria bacterium]MBT7369977.1 hypothetical protein [Gammaproteobacteria bacterium]